MKSPKPNQNKPTNTHKTKARKHWTGISKNYSTNHKVHHAAAPFDEEKRQQQKYPISHATNQTNNTTSMVRASSDQHTPQKRGEQSQTNQTKIIGTLSSSHTTHAHPNTPHKTGPVQSSLLNLTHTHTTNQIAVRGSSERNHQRSFSYRHLTKTSHNQTA